MNQLALGREAPTVNDTLARVHGSVCDAIERAGLSGIEVWSAMTTGRDVSLEELVAVGNATDVSPASFFD